VVLLPEPNRYTAESRKEGLVAEFDRNLTSSDVLKFADICGDLNPLHVDVGYASETNFRGPIVHGAFQLSLASALLGMYLPGRVALMVSANARFLSPLYYPCRVRVRGELTTWNPAARSGLLKVVITDVATETPTSEIAFNFTLHRSMSAPTPTEQVGLATVRTGGCKAIFVTGASGGVGSAVVSDLSKDYFVVALANRHLQDSLETNHQVREISCDLCSDDWERSVVDALGDRSLYGIVHAAWPGAPRGGLLNTGTEIVERQLAFGTVHTIRLARLLARQAGRDGGRLIALGSSAGGQHPVIALGAYSLGKGALEQTIRLLAPELARQGITANVIAPSFIAAGMHKGASEHQKLRETALIPAGRLCTADDVSGMVRYLLSPEASFVSGQVLQLSGAQL